MQKVVFFYEEQTILVDEEEGGHSQPPIVISFDQSRFAQTKASLGKRETPADVIAPKYDSGYLERKVANFKASLNSKNESQVACNSLLLYKLLKTLASYHQVRLADVISQLDDDSELDLSKLRFQLCNKTTIDRLVVEPH